MLRNWLAHPLTRNLDINDPRTTELRWQIIRQKAFLRRIYQEWYISIAAHLPRGSQPVLELGAGGGFLREYIPGLLTSDVFYYSQASVVLDGQHMPFGEGALRAIVMTDVLHHIPRARQFFAEAVRCLRPGSKIIMIEPWMTPWSRWVYTHLHYEPCLPDAPNWEFAGSGPLSGANDALPWIIFDRDRGRFSNEFPLLEIELVQPMMPFRYIVSGGVSMRSLMPGWSFGFWRGLENSLDRCMPSLGMFALVVINRKA
jgi:SAM-dependent methyltransferase